MKTNVIPPDKTENPFRADLLWLYALGAVLLVVLFYLPVLHNGFIDWDDRELITANPNIRSLDWDSLRWMLTPQTSIGLWIPLTFLSLAVNYAMGGLNPWVYHLTNVFLHGLNCALVFLLCHRLLRFVQKDLGSHKGESAPLWGAILATLLFGLHPIHVESVCWAAERKDVLYAFFYLFSLLLYLRYPSGPREGGLAALEAVRDGRGRLSWVLILLSLYLLALMSKPMAITLPLVFLLLDFWPLGRFQEGFWNALKEKIPFFILAGAVSLITRVEMSQGINRNFSFVFSILHAFRSAVFYLWKMIIPTGLVPFYPLPHLLDGTYYFEAVAAALAVIGLSVWVVLRRGKYPFLFTAWFYYLATLLPVLGFVQVGSFAGGDRYTYLPSLGLFFSFAGYLVFLIPGRRAVFGLLTLGLCLVLGYGTVRQIGIWRDQETLWDAEIAAYPEGSRDILMTYGNELFQQGKLGEALQQYQRASSILPPLAAPFEQSAGILMTQGDRDGAVRELRQAIGINAFSREYPMGTLYHQLWYCLEAQQKTGEALLEAQKAVKEDPNNVQAYLDMGINEFERKNYAEAEKAFQKAVDLAPLNPNCLDTLASLYRKTGRAPKAIAAYQKGIALMPHEPILYLKLAEIYSDKKKTSKALETLGSIPIAGDFSPQVLQQIGDAYRKLGRSDTAREFYARAGTVAEKH